LGDNTPLGDTSGSLLGTSVPLAEEDEEDDSHLGDASLNRRAPIFDSLNIEASYLSLCDNTAPTSPASPEPPQDEEMATPNTTPNKNQPRALF